MVTALMTFVTTPPASVTRVMNPLVSAVVGVPAIVQLLFNVNPAGSAPSTSVQVCDAAAGTQEAEYGRPTTPSGHGRERYLPVVGDEVGLVGAGAGPVGAGATAALNVAVTVSAELPASVHGAVPLHPLPLHPLNTDPDAELAVSVTDVPLG